MATHRILLTDIQTSPDGLITVRGEEAHHALRSKRLAVGDPLELLDGRGTVYEATIEHTAKIGKGDWAIEARLGKTTQTPPITPHLEVLTGVPKGPRLEQLIEGLSQTAAAAWAPLRSARSVVHPRDGKLNRLERTAAESAKQCGRAWVLNIQPETTFSSALKTGQNAKLVLADATGDPYEPSGATEIRLLIGPEGGWSQDELQAAHAADAQIASFGHHAMRIETAATVATSVILDKEDRNSKAT